MFIFKYTSMNKIKTKKKHILLLFASMVGVFLILEMQSFNQQNSSTEDCGLLIHQFEQDFFNIHQDSFDVQFNSR